MSLPQSALHARRSGALPVQAFVRTRRVGGIRFVWVGRLVISWCVSKRK